jgi:hypothetical protein
MAGTTTVTGQEPNAFSGQLTVSGQDFTLLDSSLGFTVALVFRKQY